MTKAATITTDSPHIPVSAKDSTKDRLKKFIEEETKLVKGRFRCFETPGLTTRIQVRKYPGVPMFDMTMRDGEVYEVPLYVARHLNGVDVTASAIDGKVNSCSYAVHGFSMHSPNDLAHSAMDGGGIPVPIIRAQKYTRRYGFESLEFSL